MQLSREDRIAELWRRGRLRWKLFPDQQEGIYDAIHAWLADPASAYGEFYLDISRQFGKTFCGLTIADELCRRNPRWRIPYVSATRNGMWQFVKPNMETLLSDCPAELAPQWSTTESSYLYENGSEIHLSGANNGHENDARGPRAHLVVIEEAAFVDRLNYLVESVCRPMLTTTGGRILFITTRPESPAHEVMQYLAKCKAKKAYVRRTIDDNHHLTQAAKDKLIAEAGGRDATNARREYFCETVVEEARAIVPEWEKAKGSIVAEWPRPPHWKAYEAMDPGFSPSHWGVLFGYYDFAAGKLIIEDEIDKERARSDQIAEAVKAKELELWPEKTKTVGDAKVVDVPHRWSDIDSILLADMAAVHHLPFNPTGKDLLDVMVNKLRIWVKNDRIRINPRCTNLLAQLECGLWNKQRTEFEMTPTFGHYDLIQTVVYMVRNAPETENPYPAKWAHLDPRTHLIPEEEAEVPASAAGLLQAFQRRRTLNG